MRIRLISSTYDNIDLEVPDTTQVQWITEDVLSVYFMPIEREVVKIGEFKDVLCWFVVEYFREEDSE